MLSYFGVLIVYSADLDSFGPNQSKGAGLVLISAFVFGLYVVYADVWMKVVRSIDFTSVAMISACCLTLLHAWSVHGTKMMAFPLQFYLIAACLGFFCTFLPSYMISYGIKQVGSTQASIFACLGPAFTIGVAFFTLGENFGMLELFGMMLTVLASLIISKKSHSK
jgi:drug/metabolite transporter (DMT)-like permease